MKARTLLSLAVASILALACAKPCRIVWTEGSTDPETGKTSYSFRKE